MEEDGRDIITVRNKSFGRYIPYKRISEGIDRVAAVLESEYGSGELGIPLFVGVLNGAFMFFSELMKRISFPCEVSFVRFASYAGTVSQGSVEEIIGLREDIAGRRVVIVEDIVETGRTIQRLTETISPLGPAGIEVVTLLSKPSSFCGGPYRMYAALEVPDEFIIGFGLDYDGLGRNLIDLYRITDEKQRG